MVTIVVVKDKHEKGIICSSCVLCARVTEDLLVSSCVNEVQVEDIRLAYEHACNLTERVNDFFTFPMGITIIGAAVMFCYSIYSFFMIREVSEFTASYFFETASLLAGYLIPSTLLNQSVSICLCRVEYKLTYFRKYQILNFPHSSSVSQKV